MRFFAGLVAAAIVCIFHMEQHAWLVSMWTAELQNPYGYHMNGCRSAVHEYGWYLWHYLYDDYLQQVWALFAILFVFGGLIRERNDGTVSSETWPMISARSFPVQTASRLRTSGE